MKEKLTSKQYFYTGQFIFGQHNNNQHLNDFWKFDNDCIINIEENKEISLEKYWFSSSTRYATQNIQIKRSNIFGFLWITGV